eukprot:250089-Hanusia_phi.AAC.7
MAGGADRGWDDDSRDAARQFQPPLLFQLACHLLAPHLLLLHPASSPALRSLPWHRHQRPRCHETRGRRSPPLPLLTFRRSRTFASGKLSPSRERLTRCRCDRGEEISRRRERRGGRGEKKGEGGVTRASDHCSDFGIWFRCASCTS